MHRRVNYITAWPDAAKAMLALQDVVNTSGLETSLLNLVCLRASQINSGDQRLEPVCDCLPAAAGASPAPPSRGRRRMKEEGS